MFETVAQENALKLTCRSKFGSQCYLTVQNTWSYFQISERSNEHNINPEDVEIYVEFVLDGVSPQYQEERVFPLAVKIDPMISDSQENVDFNSNWPCTDQHVQIKASTCCFLFVMGFTFALWLFDNKKTKKHLTDILCLISGQRSP